MKTVQIQISWLLQKPTDLDLHCLLRQGMSCLAREGLRKIFEPANDKTYNKMCATREDSDQLISLR